MHFIYFVQALNLNMPQVKRMRNTMAFVLIFSPCVHLIVEKLVFTSLIKQQRVFIKSVVF